MKNEEIILYFCMDHGNLNLSKAYSHYVFNCYPNYNPHRCNVEKCKEEAFNKMVGIRIPSTVGDLSGLTSTINSSIMDEARSIFCDKPAKTGLLAYLFFKIRLFSDSGDALAVQILKPLTKLLLSELNISADLPISDHNLKRLLFKLTLLPNQEKVI